MQTPFREIHSSPDILGGATVFKGTRVPFDGLLDYLKAGDTVDDFVRDYPSVTKEQALRALEEVMRTVEKIASENPS